MRGIQWFAGIDLISGSSEESMGMQQTKKSQNRLLRWNIDDSGRKVMGKILDTRYRQAIKRLDWRASTAELQRVTTLIEGQRAYFLT